MNWRCVSMVSIHTWAWNCAFCCSIAIIRCSSAASALSDELKFSKLSIAFSNSYRTSLYSCWQEASEMRWPSVSPQVSAAACLTPLIYKLWDGLHRVAPALWVICKSACKISRKWRMQRCFITNRIRLWRKKLWPEAFSINLLLHRFFIRVNSLQIRPIILGWPSWGQLFYERGTINAS